jgi:hypothetical protein
MDDILLVAVFGGSLMAALGLQKAVLQLLLHAITARGK